MLQPVFSECLFLDLLSHFQDLYATTVIDVGGCQDVQALVVTTVVIVIGKGTYLAFQVANRFPRESSSSWSDASFRS